MKLKSGEIRVWKMVEIEDYTEFKRPKSQGGMWYLAKRIKIIDEMVFQLPKINRVFP